MLVIKAKNQYIFHFNTQNQWFWGLDLKLLHLLVVFNLKKCVNYTLYVGFLREKIKEIFVKILVYMCMKILIIIFMYFCSGKIGFFSKLFCIVSVRISASLGAEILPIMAFYFCLEKSISLSKLLICKIKILALLGARILIIIIMSFYIYYAYFLSGNCAINFPIYCKITVSIWKNFVAVNYKIYCKIDSLRAFLEVLNPLSKFILAKFKAKKPSSCKKFSLIQNFKAIIFLSYCRFIYFQAKYSKRKKTLLCIERAFFRFLLEARKPSIFSIWAKFKAWKIFLNKNFRPIQNFEAIISSNYCGIIHIQTKINFSYSRFRAFLIHFFGKKTLGGHGACRGSFSKSIAGSTCFWLNVNIYFQTTLGSVVSSGNSSRPAITAWSQESYESRWAELYSTRSPLVLRRINRCNARSTTVSSTSFLELTNVYSIPSIMLVREDRQVMTIGSKNHFLELVGQKSITWVSAKLVVLGRKGGCLGKWHSFKNLLFFVHK